MYERCDRAYAEFIRRRQQMEAEQAIWDLFRKAFVMGYMAALDEPEEDPRETAGKPSRAIDATPRF